MAYSDTRLATLLPLIVTQLRTDLSLVDATCHLGDPMQPVKHPTPKTLHIVVGMAPGGSFDEGLWDGGGREQLTADAQLAVRIETKVALDQPGHDKSKQTDANYGLFPEMHRVLDSLAALVPVDGSANSLLREPIQPVGWDGPDRIGDRQAALVVRFRCLFDWDLDAL